MSATSERFDGIYMTVAQQCGGIDEIMDSFFGFLQRKTDFYTAHDDDSKPRQLVLEAYSRQLPHAEKKRAEEKGRRAKDDESRRARDKTRREAEQKAAAAKAEAAAAARAAEPGSSGSRVMEVDVDGNEIGVAPTVDAAAKEEKTEKADGDESEESKGAAPNAGNGLDLGSYSWTQSLQQVELVVPIPPGTRGRDCKVEFKAKKLSIAVRGDAIIAAGSELHDRILVDECTWTLVDGSSLVVGLEKVDQMKWWTCVVAGDLEVDTGKIVPENSKLSDLDGETRKTVEKMMHDQRQKQAGKPTSDQQSQADMLDKFKAQHPEMDFSNCKVNYGGEGGGFGDMGNLLQ